MTPKEKAIDLVDKFEEYSESRRSESGRDFDKKYCSKQCALVAVDEIINNVLIGIDLPSTWGNYWNKVKQEIEKL